MSSNQLFCKYLEAGAKSSAVVLDPTLQTGNEQTLYLYHLQRNQIIEYRRDIVETKLRELSGEEQGTATTLQQAYEQARATFTPRGAAALTLPEQAPAKKATAPRGVDEEEGESDDDDIGFIDDNELLDDEDLEEEESD